MGLNLNYIVNTLLKTKIMNDDTTPIPVKPLGSVTKSTKTGYFAGDIAPASTGYTLTVQKPVELQALTVSFDVDIKEVLRLEISFYDGATWQTHKAIHPLGGTHTSPERLYLPYLAYDGLFELVENDVEGRILRLKTPITVAGFKINVINGDNVTHKAACSLVYTEKEWRL